MAKRYYYHALVIRSNLKVLPNWLKLVLKDFGEVVLVQNMEFAPDPVKSTEELLILAKGQKPPTYFHMGDPKLFTPTMFINLALGDYKMFADNAGNFVRIKGAEARIYSRELHLYASMHIKNFMQVFEQSGKPSFGERVLQILQAKYEFLASPVGMVETTAITAMEWDRGLLNLDEGDQNANS